MTKGERVAALSRPAARRDPALIATVATILDDIERRGADAVNEWCEKLDGAPAAELRLGGETVDRARASIDERDLRALDVAVENIRRYHAAIKPRDAIIEFEFGLECRRIHRAIKACGLYVPGGTAPLFSTLLMLALPAEVAGVALRVAVTPPPRSGAVPAIITAAAAACGLDSLWLAGGAQAIGALAYGAVLPGVDKIFGPGNAYVAEAKRQVAARGVAAIDLPAGPSELMLIADESADPAIVAADLLGQAEHDPGAQVVLVTLSKEFSERVDAEITVQLTDLPRCAAAAAALSNSTSIIARTGEEAAEIANAYAPEHLSINTADAESLAARIENAGAIFVGAASAEAFGDYICGPSHVLPTDGAARVYGGVTTSSFMKTISVQRLGGKAAAMLGPATARLARLEGLEAHARSVERRQ